jgi:hypothetical protein
MANMVNVQFHNDDQADLFLKVWDLNQLDPNDEEKPLLVQQ